MSWQDYVDKQLMASRCVKKAAIAGHDGNVWAKSEGFEVSFFLCQVDKYSLRGQCFCKLLILVWILVLNGDFVQFVVGSMDDEFFIRRVWQDGDMWWEPVIRIRNVNFVRVTIVFNISKLRFPHSLSHSIWNLLKCNLLDVFMHRARLPAGISLVYVQYLRVYSVS